MEFQLVCINLNILPLLLSKKFSISLANDLCPHKMATCAQFHTIKPL